MDDTLLWQLRHFIYNHFAETAHAPSVDEAARRFHISAQDARTLYQALNDRHALFLEPGTTDVRMAWPFSGVPTDFRVQARGQTYFANCAWDLLGIPAALQADVTLQAVCAESNELVELQVKGCQVADSGLLIHYPLPFARWYDDVTFT